MLYDIRSAFLSDLPSPLRAMHLVERAPGFTLKSHNHPFYHLTIITNGTLHVTFKNQDYRIRQGQAVLLPPRYSHALSSPHGYTQIGIDIFDVPDNRFIYDLLHQTFPSGFGIVSFPTSPLTFDEIFQAMHNTAELNKLKLFNRAESFLVQFLESGQNIADTRFAHKFMQMISQPGGLQLSLAEMCRQVHLSKTHFERLVRKEFGCGAAEYCNRVKVMKACSLLQDTDLSISEISQILNFNNPAHFSSFFKLRMQLSPKAYRNISRSPVPATENAKAEEEKREPDI